MHRSADSPRVVDLRVVRRDRAGDVSVVRDTGAVVHPVLGVRLQLYGAGEAARVASIGGGRFAYRPSWGLPGTDHPDVTASAPVLCLDRPVVHPGDSAVGALVPLFPDAWATVAAGDVLYCYEGRRRVGEAVVLRRGDTVMPVPSEVEDAWRAWAEQQAR